MSPGYVPDDGQVGHQHPSGHRGRLDESRWRLSHEELAVARLLVSEGHDVRSRPQRSRLGRTGDFDVCGRETEVKTLGPNATGKSVTNALMRAQGQGVDVIVDASTTRLHRLGVDRGVAEFARRQDTGIDARPSAREIERIRVIGRGFDRSYRLGETLEVGQRAAHRSPQGVGLGLGFA